jgi:hypothetical protein
MPDSRRKDYEGAIKIIDNSPKDRIGTLGKAGLAAIGAVAGGAAATTVTTALGVTSIPLLTTAASWVGVTVVAATPIGWVVAMGVATGSAVFVASKAFKSGIIVDKNKAENIRKLRKAIEELDKEANRTSDIDEKYSKLEAMYLLLINKKEVDEDVAKEILEGVKSGSINYDFAYSNCIKMLDETIKAS